jgi:hypothetical protein
MQAEIDDDVLNRAEEMVQEALRVVMQGVSISPKELDCHRHRGNIAIREIVNILHDLAEEYDLPEDLLRALFIVADGEGDKLLFLPLPEEPDLSGKQRTDELLRFLKVDPEARFLCSEGCEHPAREFVMSILHKHQDDALKAAFRVLDDQRAGTMGEA